MRHLLKLSTLLVFCAMMAIFPNISHAIQKAVVKHNRAIVYADVEMKVPIGYLKKGIIIHVGSHPKNKGRLLPLIVSGKVTYIKIKDLRLESDPTTRDDELKRFTDYNIEQLELAQEDKLGENNHILFGIGQYSMGRTWNSLAEKVDNEKDKQALSLKLLFEHRPKGQRLSYAFGFGYYSLTQNDILFKSITIEGNVSVALLMNKAFYWTLSVGPLVSAATVVEVKGADVPFRGSMYGFNAGTRITFFPENTWGLFAGVYYQKMNFTNFDTVTLPETGETIEMDNLSGLNMLVGMSFKFL